MPRLTRSRVSISWLLVLHAYLLLVRFDFYITTTNLQGLLTRVRKRPTIRKHHRLSVEPIISAMDLACVFYRKEVLCLQRAAATTCLMRLHGIEAELVIGAQMMPLKAHAWVEINREVVGERSQLPTSLAILDRC
jgi:Transglutaminase-like superfamily